MSSKDISYKLWDPEIYRNPKHSRFQQNTIAKFMSPISWLLFPPKIHCTWVSIWSTVPVNLYKKISKHLCTTQLFNRNLLFTFLFYHCIFQVNLIQCIRYIVILLCVNKWYASPLLLNKVCQIKIAVILDFVIVTNSSLWLTPFGAWDQSCVFCFPLIKNTTWEFSWLFKIVQIFIHHNCSSSQPEQVIVIWDKCLELTHTSVLTPSASVRFSVVLSANFSVNSRLMILNWAW